MLDVYWGRAAAPRSVLDFLLFVCFFPQVTAGPISRGSELLIQLEQPRKFTPTRLAAGSRSFLLGFALKAFAADLIGTTWVNPVFADSANFSRFSHLVAIFGYPLQVFGDFAGYSLMAIGVAEFFGISLPVNFNFPFLSKSLAELWRRWHITLNRWLFDYIFTPLSTSHGWWRGQLRSSALLITFLASGLWHGAQWTFVLWGLFHALGMIIHRNWDERYRLLCRRNRAYVRLRQSVPYMIGAWALTTTFFGVSLIPFRAPSVAQAIIFFRGTLVNTGVQTLRYRWEVFGAGFIVFYHCAELPWLRRWRDGFFELPAPVRGVFYGLVITFLALAVPMSAGSFIYQQF